MARRGADGMPIGLAIGRHCLHWRCPGAAHNANSAVAAGMTAGFLTSVIWVSLLKQHSYDLYEAIPGFFAGALVTVLVSHLTYKAESGES